MTANSTDYLFLGDAWNFLKLHRVKVLGFLFIPCTLAFFATFLMKPVYRADILLSPISTDNESSALDMIRGGQFGAIANLVGLSGTGGSTEENLALLRANGFIQSFIDQNSLVPEIYPERWNHDKAKWKRHLWKKLPTLNDATERFLNDVLVVKNHQSVGVYVLSVYWHDAEKAALWASKLVELLNRKVAGRELLEAEQSLAFLRQELETTPSVEIREGIYRMIEQQLARKMLTNTRKEFAFKVLDGPVIPDADQFVWPNRLVLSGGVFLLSFLIVLIYAVTAMPSQKK